MKVLVCDDRADRCGAIVARIEALGLADLAVEGVCGDNGNDLKSEIESLFRRVKYFLGESGGNNAPNKFDQADLILIDNNLAYLPMAGVRFTAESIIGYVRAFTKAGYIVSLNKNPEVDFDLRFLVGDYASRADLALNDKHLASTWLWERRNDPDQLFRPWYWPTLKYVHDQRRQQIDFVRTNLDQSILKAMKFPEDGVATLSRHALGALSPDGELEANNDGGATSAGNITFRDMFLSSSRAIPDSADRANLNERSLSSAEHADVVSRAVAADIDFWIRRDVSGPQDVLVDTPHLLTRMPFLLGERASELDVWNGHIATVDPPYGLDPALFAEHLAKYQFEHSCWVRSPSFWWTSLAEDKGLSSLFYKDGTRWANAVFCEDVSRFVDRDALAGQAVREFVAEFEGPWERRYVVRLNSFKYAPRSRFAL